MQQPQGWSGSELPDIGLLQLRVRDLPALELAVEDHVLTPGKAIATAGFQMGNYPLTINGRINQRMPFLRQGIISSVFPFPIHQPHGFTIDILQQGGSSGSPIFESDTGRVLGIMASGIQQAGQDTNVSICEAAIHLKQTLDLFYQLYAPDISNIPTLPEYLKTLPQVQDGEKNWQILGAHIE